MTRRNKGNTMNSTSTHQPRLDPSPKEDGAPESTESNPQVDSTERTLDLAFAKSLLEECRSIAVNQFTVNALMAGDDWVHAASEHREIDYRMAILDELQEFWNCAWRFKWWDKKSNSIDYKNARMELVDILHFLVSEDLCLTCYDPYQVSDDDYQAVAEKMVNGIQEATCSEPADLRENWLNAHREALLKSAMMKFINNLCGASTVVDWGNFWKMVILSQPVADAGESSNTEGGVLEEVNAVLNLYKAKAVLNKFRTRYRSTPAGYRKVWVDGREDNDVLMSWLDNQAEFPSASEINQWLEVTYHRASANLTV